MKKKKKLNILLTFIIYNLLTNTTNITLPLLKSPLFVISYIFKSTVSNNLK